MNSKKQFNQFLELILTLEPVEFIGLARILCIDLMSDDKKNSRDFYDILKDMLDKFPTLGRKQRREIISVLKQNKKGK